MVITIGPEKAFGKSQHLIIISKKTKLNIGIEENFFNMKKVIYKKNPTANILEGERLNVFP